MSLVAPQTLSIYDNWKVGKKSCMLYDIGLAEDFKDQEGKSASKLKNLNFKVVGHLLNGIIYSYMERSSLYHFLKSY